MWFAKPAGMTYAALDAALGPLVTSGDGCLWMRFMVLGPTPEFCLHGSDPIELPAPFAPISLGLRPVFP
jgi:hypothetical protein